MEQVKVQNNDCIFLPSLFLYREHRNVLGSNKKGYNLSTMKIT